MTIQVFRDLADRHHFRFSARGRYGRIAQGDRQPKITQLLLFKGGCRPLVTVALRRPQPG